MMSMPLSLRAQMGPNPRIIDDASWAKLMAAGLTLNAEDLKPYGSGRSRKAGWQATYPVEMVRAMVGVWLFGGCRVDEIRRLELDCVTWDQGTDDTTGALFTICLLHIPQNQTSRPFNKPDGPPPGVPALTHRKVTLLFRFSITCHFLQTATSRHLHAMYRLSPHRVVMDG
ncbi:hypothetical protein ACWCOZ_18450 [Streptomyces sp. NPDC001840]